MSVLTRLLLVVTLVSFTSACSRDSEPAAQQPPAAVSAPPAQTGAGTGAAKPDTRFVEEQLALGDKEVGLARVAAERATTPAVKSYAAMLMRDHQQAGDELRQVAERQQVKPRTDQTQLNEERERLSKLSGAAFEREYLDEMIADHDDAVNDLESASKDENTDVRGWAVKHLPHVRRHLEEARQLRKGMDRK